MAVNIIGIDCATDPKNIGLALGGFNKNNFVIKEAKKVQKGETVIDAIISWINPDVETLLAIDAPLGWPLALGNHLNKHNAGDVLEPEPNMLFRRATDLFIKKVTGKQSLDVGADRIARTAHSALKILHGLREQTGQRIPLAWNNELVDKVSAIEVYPAATLRVSGIRSTGYKKKEHLEQRVEIVNELKDMVTFDLDTSVLENDDDILDAAVCVLAGYDFLSSNTLEPEDTELAKKEGWIWVCNKRM